MKRLFCVAALLLIVSASGAATFRQLEASGLQALRRHDYATAVRCFSTALRQSGPRGATVSSILDVKGYAALAYVEQGNYPAALRMCDDVLRNAASTPVQTKIARYQKSKALAAELYSEGIRDVTEVYKRSRDSAVAHRFMDLVVDRHPAGFNVGGIIDQLERIVLHDGYSAEVSDICFRACAKWGIEPKALYGRLLKAAPRLAESPNFMLDYGKGLGTTDCAAALHCLDAVVMRTRSPLLKAQALFQRYLVDLNMHRLSAASKDLWACKALVDKKKFAEMVGTVNSSLAVPARWAKALNPGANGER